MTEIVDFLGILTELGYQLQDTGKEWRAKPLYRESGNNTSLAINKSTGNFIDYGTGNRGNFLMLVQLTLGLKSLVDSELYLKNKYNFVAPKITYKSKIKIQKTFNIADFNIDFNNHDYWLKKGYSEELMIQFGGGFCKDGRLRGRYVFPIYEGKKLVGISGRSVNYTEFSGPKWKHIGNKTEWLFNPFQDNNKEIILLESIGDAIALADIGLKNTRVLFGVELSIKILNHLISTDAEKIFISTNNDQNNGFVGNLAAKRIEKKLQKFFDKSQIIIKLPIYAKDFGCQTRLENVEYKESLWNV